MSRRADVVVIGAGHNGLACACYLARAGLDVVVVEQAAEVGGCIHTRDLPDGRGRLEIGSYEHGGIRGTGVSADLELETRFGLAFHLREEITLAPCDDGSALPLYSSLERTVEALGEVVGAGDAAAYRDFATWSARAMTLLRAAEAGPPPTLRELAALAEATLGRAGEVLVQTLLSSASNVVRSRFSDGRLQGLLSHWAAHSQQPPTDPGTSAGALALAGGHGAPAARPVGGSRSTALALERCFAAAGGELRLGAPAERVELAGGRAVAVVCGGERIEAVRAVVSAIDARRLFLGLVDRAALAPALVEEVSRIHVGRRNVSELKVDCVLGRLPDVPGPAGFERAFMLSPNTQDDIERAFAEIGLGLLPSRPPVMIAFPSTLEPGWAPEGRHVLWLSTFVPWRPAAGEWTPESLERAADWALEVAARPLGGPLEVVERHVTGPGQWVERTGNPYACPNHVEMSIDQLLGMRPSPSLARYRTPVGRLYLTGAGTHPGGGVTGAPGRNAARVVLGDLGARPRAAQLRELRARAALVRDAARAALALRSGGRR